MSIVLDILEILWNTTANYKGVRTNIFGIPKEWIHDKNSTYSTLSRLSKKGFVDNKSGRWVITKHGKEYFVKHNKFLLKFDSPFQKNSPRTLILMFDIPESRSLERKWLRLHLKKFNYFMVQKSVWVGPAPLPKEFTDYLKEIKLKDCIKTFKLAKPYQIKNNAT